ncbi:nucleolar protein 10, variant 1 [Capsaspora owczarzaki ATCC 30864]|nr:nucleolar protein 10, variant 1 [Capsaspora owczarzaki ATCC 30864]
MPTAATNLRASKDGRFLLATGVYPPRIRCYELSELAMKFERYLQSEPVKFEMLSDDYTKIACLSSDRFLEIHAQYGTHYKTRIPRFGRDLAYMESATELIAVGDSTDIYRLNLELGRFMTPWASSIGSQGGLNVVALNSVHDLVAVGSVDGRIECWDPRSRTCHGQLDIAAILAQGSSIDSAGIPEVTSIQFDTDGLSMAVGVSTGQVLLFDVRSDQPVLIKDHQYGFPIKRIKFHRPSGKMVTADTKIIKIWERNTGETYTSIEPEHDINDALMYGDSGLILTANEDKKMQAYYVPSLGNAPKWCSFLDNLTEELEETAQPEVFDDYKFVTRKDLEVLGLTHLVGTNLLRAYMHGFFIDLRLYNRAKAIAEPFAYEEYRKSKIKEKIDAQRANRISVQKRLPKVNKGFAKLLLDEESAETNAKKKAALQSSNPLTDDRFGAMFKNPEFEIDPESETFRILHPTLSKSTAQLQHMFREVGKPAKADDDDDDDEDELEGRASDDDNSDEEDEREAAAAAKAAARAKKEKAAAKTKFYEIKDDANSGLVNAMGATSDKAIAIAKRRAAVPLGIRAQTETIDMATATRAPVGAMQMTFVRETNKDKARKPAAPKDDIPRERRGVKELRLKKQGGPAYWRGHRVK